MRLSFGLALISLACAWCGAETAWAQYGYSDKVVYGMFGPRVLGQTLQSPVQRPDRGIARDVYGDFLGVNRAYSGRRFPEARPRHPTVDSVPVPLPPQVEPEAQPVPDEWLRTESSGAGVDPWPWTIDAEEPDSSSLRGPRRTPGNPGATAVLVGLPSGAPASDPFARRIAAVLESTNRIKKLSPIHVTVVNETAILRGRVASVQDRDLAENLVRLEPGIWDIKNELVVEKPARVAATNATTASRP